MEDFETKEITSTPRTEDKDRDVKSGAQRAFACSDPRCQFAGSWHVHEGGGIRGSGGR